MKVGVTGASGMLGGALVGLLSKTHKVFATSRSRGVEGENITWNCFDLTDTVLLNEWLNKIKPDIVIHCAAIVNVDFCEENFDLAVKLHAEATMVMSNYLESNNGRLIYISTDSVFDGKKHKPYSESDLVNPLNIYAETKLMGEKYVQLMTNGLVLRTNIIGWTREGNFSFSEWVLKGLIHNSPLNLFYDVNFSPIHVHDLSLIIGRIISNPIFGLYNCVSRDSISKYNFGKKMAKIFQLSDSSINMASLDDMKFKASRPKNMALSISKISAVFEYDFPDSVDAIELMKRQYSNNK